MASPDKSKSLSALAGANFTLADARDGLGPFLGVFLLGEGWGPGLIGTVMALGSVAGMLATAPFGALVDISHAKRIVVILAAIVIIIATMLMLYAPSFPLVAASQIGSGLAAAAIGPALAGITLGLAGAAKYAHQLGRNEAWFHSGNAFAAIAAGTLGYIYGLPAVFYLMTAMSIGAIACMLLIKDSDIDHDVARGLERGEKHAGGFAEAIPLIRQSRPLLILSIALMIFHFGNAAMLPLLSQSIVSRQLADPALFTASTVIIAQLTMVPVALFAAWFAQRRGYYPLILLALLVLPLRGLLASVWQDTAAVVPVQMLDGIGAGLLGVATPGIVASILRGTGHINLGLGGVMTVQTIGASLSPLAAGWIAQEFGYEASFVILAAIAALGTIFWWWTGKALAHYGVEPVETEEV